MADLPGKPRNGNREAAATFQRSLDIRQRVLPPNSLETAQGLNNLALLYTSQGQVCLHTSMCASIVWVCLSSASTVNVGCCRPSRDVTCVGLVCFKCVSLKGRMDLSVVVVSVRFCSLFWGG